MIPISRATAVVIAALVGILAGCAITTDELKALANLPTLVGKWKGEWAGTMAHPIEMVIEKQEGGKVSGTMTFYAHPTSTHRLTGTIGAKPDGSVWVLADVEGREFPLKVISERQLEGTGRSRTHVGPVTLVRE